MKNSLKVSLTLLTVLGIGFTPILGISLRIFELAPLYISFWAIIVPAMIISIIMSHKDKDIGLLFLHGLKSGIFSVFVYDLARWSLSFLLKLNDFIPKIGGWLLNDNQQYFTISYLYRYIGNGGGLGIGFSALMSILMIYRSKHKFKLDEMIWGIGYGIFVWICLLITLKLSTHGEELMFKLDLRYIIVTFLGHVVFGSCLGIYFKFYPMIAIYTHDFSLKIKIENRTQYLSMFWDRPHYHSKITSE